MTRLRVLHLRDTDRLCGPGKTILETVRLSDDREIDYVVAAFRSRRPNEFLARVGPHCPTRELSESRLLLASTAFLLARDLRRERIDILHAHDFKTNVLASMAGPLARVPVVTTVHGYIAISGKSRAYRYLDRGLLRRMDRVIAVSDAMYREFLDQGIRPGRLRLIRNCIVLDRYPFGFRDSTVREESGVGEGDPVIGCIGRLSPEKGQMRAIEVLPDVLRRFPRARLVIAGDGPDLPRLEARAAEVGVAGAVVFLGYRERVLDVFGSLDLLVLSSDTEGLPNVVLEAMALGVPVVATAVGGTPELVRNGETGLLVPPGDREALSAAIVEALSSGEAAVRRASAARAFVEREHAMEGLVRKTHELYRDLAAQGE